MSALPSPCFLLLAMVAAGCTDPFSKVKADDPQGEGQGVQGDQDSGDTGAGDSGDGGGGDGGGGDGGGGGTDSDGDGTPDAEDCDPDNPDAHPGAPERCNGEDDDCDGDVDESEDVVDGREFYADGDGDGFGDSSTAVTACSAPSGMVRTPGDCDDTAAAVNPDAAEVCGDGVDSDCNGQDTTCVFGTTSSLADATTALNGDASDQLVGIAVAGAGDVDGDGRGDLLVGAQGWEGTGAALLYTGVPATGSADATAELLLGEETGAMTGRALAAAGDTDGDGYDDVLVAAPRSSLSEAGAGAAWLLPGPLAGGGELSQLASATFTGSDNGDQAGFSIDGVGDMDGDGELDFIMGASLADPGGPDSGAAWLVHGPVTGELGLASADTRWDGDSTEDRAGRSVAGVGDLNGDGLADVAVGAWQEDQAAADAGAVYVLYGPASAGGSLTGADGVLTGTAAGDNAGWWVAWAGDCDNDGLDDLLIGGPGAGSGAGSAWLVVGPATGTAGLATAASTWAGIDPGDLAGRSVDGGHDLDGDGNLDMVVGAPGADSSAGAAYLVMGPLSGRNESLADADTTLQGSAGSNAGHAVATATDINGDGLDEVLVGAFADSSGGSAAGAAFLILGE